VVEDNRAPVLTADRVDAALKRAPGASPSLLMTVAVRGGIEFQKPYPNVPTKARVTLVEPSICRIDPRMSSLVAPIGML